MLEKTPSTKLFQLLAEAEPLEVKEPCRVPLADWFELGEKSLSVIDLLRGYASKTSMVLPAASDRHSDSGAPSLVKLDVVLLSLPTHHTDSIVFI